METIICQICSSDKFKNFIFVKDRFGKDSKRDYKIVKCSCGFYYLNPRPNVEAISQFDLAKDLMLLSNLSALTPLASRY